MIVSTTNKSLNILALLLIFALSGCLDLADGAQTTLIKESGNHSKKKTALLFLREAGATVGDSYHVSITDYDHILLKAEVGNTLTVDNDHGKTVLSPGSIDLSWKSNDTLEIGYDKKLRTFTQNSPVDGVVILYKAR